MNEAVSRVERYLNERAKHRNLEKAYIHWINAGASSEAVLRSEDIVEVLKQRAELLEALKELSDLMDDVRSGNYEPDSFTTQPARTAISRAEK